MAKAKRERRYYGCKHCGSWCVASLRTCIGDRRDGMRCDYQCKVCGGVYGSAAHGHVFIDERDWMDETGEEMPRPNPQRMLAMKILITLEEQFRFKFRSHELKVVETITPLIAEDHKKMIQANTNMRERLKKISQLT